jgi:hypothetical protein
VFGLRGEGHCVLRASCMSATCVFCFVFYAILLLHAYFSVLTCCSGTVIGLCVYCCVLFAGAGSLQGFFVSLVFLFV